MEKLIGFNAREMWLSSPSELYPIHPPGTFRLKDDIQKPLSTGKYTWPSLFSYVAWEDEALPEPGWIGVMGPAWESLDYLESTVRQHWGSGGKPYWIIALSVFTGLFTERDWAHWTSVRYPTWNTNPAERNPAWELLGYDVSDLDYLSGLSDCGYDPEEKLDLVPRFASHLNQWHLFTDHTKAFEFKQVSDERVREHAPFYVYGLYVIRRHVPV